MKKSIFLLAATLVLLCGCKDNKMPDETVPSTGVTTEAITTSATETTEVTATEIVTTAAVTEPPVVSLAPKVITANSYQKKAVDMLGYGGIDFTHSVTYPKIDSDKPGATELNEKIKSEYGKIIDTLKNSKEENILYNVTYESSVCEDVIFIRIIETIGWQYSEGYSAQKIYYYDAVNDAILTVDDYIAHFGIKIQKCMDSILCSSDLAKAGFGLGNTYLTDKVGGKPLGAPATDTLFYAAYEELDKSVILEGIEVTNTEIRLYLSGTAYVTGTFRCDLLRDTYIPVRPNYAGYTMTWENAESKDLQLKFENKKVVEFTLPSRYGIYSVNYDSDKVTVLSKNPLGETELYINGKLIEGGYSDGYLGVESGFDRTIYISEYIPMDELTNITLKFK